MWTSLCGCRAERDRARVGQYTANDKLFTEDTDPSSSPMFIPNPQVQEVCQAVSGFIYVANAEPGKGKDAGRGQLKVLVSLP